MAIEDWLGMVQKEWGISKTIREMLNEPFDEGDEDES